MLEFGGLQKHKTKDEINVPKTQHAYVGLGRAALAAAVALPKQNGPNFPKNCKKKKITQ